MLLQHHHIKGGSTKGDDANKQANFATHKARHIESIQSRMAALQAALSCLNME